MDMSPVNLFGMTRPELEAWFEVAGEKTFRARQVMTWLYRHQARDFDRMTNIGRSARELLCRTAAIALPQIEQKQRSRDGTIKWLLMLDGGQGIETVFIPEPNRGTLCISSQVGCALDCAFCATGEQGFNRNLSAAEIVAQVWLARRELGYVPGGHRIITNVVLMGMGEPLANYRNVIKAARILTDDFGLGLSRHRLTLSTSGLVPRIDQLARDCQLALAVSLHAPNDELRDRLVPINRKHPIAELLDACWRYAASDKRGKITFEYSMMAGVNDSLEHAEELSTLLRDRPAKVNLIPFNSYSGARFSCSPESVMHGFRDALRSNGIVATLRKTRGSDIAAACGQLKGRVEDRTRIRLGQKSFQLAVQT